MKRIVIIFLLVLNAIAAKAQDSDTTMSLKERVFYHYDRSEFEEVVRFGKEALTVYEAEGDLLEMAGCYNVLGVAYQRLGRFEESIENYEHCADVMEQLKAGEGEKEQKQTARFYDKNIRYTRNNMAKVFLVMEEFDQAEKLYLDCIQMLGDPIDTIDFQDLATYWQNLSEVYMKQAKGEVGEEKATFLQASVDYAERSVALSEQYDVLPFKRVTKVVMLAQAYRAAGRTDEALAVAQEALASAEVIDDPYLLAEAYAVLGGCEADLGQNKIAEGHLRQALDLATENHFDELQIDFLKSACTVARHFDKGLALDYFEQYTAIKDSVFNERQQQLIRDYQVKYDLAEKEHQIAFQTAQNESNKMIIILLTVLALLLLILFAMGMYISRARKLKNKALEQNSWVKDRVFSIVSHDFKTSVLSQNLLLDVMEKHFDEMQPSGIKEKVSTLKTSSDMLKENMLNMIEWMKMEMGGGIGKKSGFNVRTLVEESVESQWIDVSKKRLHIINDVEEGFAACDDVDLTRLILRNLINNAVKFSLPDGTIRIWAEEGNGRIWLVVADQGKGMKRDHLERLSNEPVSPKSRAQGNGGSGIGLALCKDLLELNGEKIDIQSEEDKGTTVRFSLKK